MLCSLKIGKVHREFGILFNTSNLADSFGDTKLPYNTTQDNAESSLSRKPARAINLFSHFDMQPRSHSIYYAIHVSHGKIMLLENSQKDGKTPK